MDSSISPDTGEDQELSTDAEMPVPIDALVIGDQRPEVGDQVSFTVKGPITRIVNDMVYVKPETVNDQPMPAPPIKPDPSVDEGSRLQDLSRQYDANGVS